MAKNKDQKKKKIKKDPNLDMLGRKPRIEDTVDPERFWHERPSWCFACIDQAHNRWKFSHEAMDQEFIMKLISYEGQTWGEILQATSGKTWGTRSHAIPISDLSTEAQKRLTEIRRDGEDVLYSIRIKSRHRWWGVIRGGIFYFIWNDSNHEICPSKRE